jgi:predicted nuclease of predicted toxin-antitoxin system
VRIRCYPILLSSDSDEYDNTLQKPKPKEVVKSLTTENLNEDQIEDSCIEEKDVKTVEISEANELQHVHLNNIITSL